MKMKFLITTLLGIISVSAFAQKGELSNAQSEYDKYTTVSGQKAMVAIANTSLNNAKISIDKASLNQKTAALPQTYALKAGIYGSLALTDTISTTSTVSFNTGFEALKKAKELDTKGEFKSVTDRASLILAQYMLNKGVASYQNKKYEDAYKAFDSGRQIIPDDTTAILNTAVAAINYKNYSAAITNYNKLLTLNYNRKVGAYEDLASLYLETKDTVNALKTIDEAVTKYPSSNELRKRDIELNLRAGRQTDLLGKIEAAIKSEPNNKMLYYYEGLTYSQIAEDTKKAIKKIKKTAGPKPSVKDEASIRSLEAKTQDSYTKSAEVYKKALAIDPGFPEVNINIGYVLIAPAIDNFNAAQQLPVNDKKGYDEAISKANAQLETAKPYLLKAVELNPKSVEALTNLKSYYLGKNDLINANKIQKQLDAIK